MAGVFSGQKQDGEVPREVAYAKFLNPKSKSKLLPSSLMAPSAVAADYSPPSSPGSAENHLQPFFVLHKASSQKKRKPTGTVKTKRRIDLSPPLPKSAEKSEIDIAEECDDDRFVNLRMEAFEIVWSKIATIKDVLRNINTNAFNEIHNWVRESFNTIRSFGMPTSMKQLRLFPL